MPLKQCGVRPPTGLAALTTEIGRDPSQDRIWVSSVPDPGLSTPRSWNGTGDTQIAAADVAPVAAPVPLDFESTTDALTADMSPPASPYRRASQGCGMRMA